MSDTACDAHLYFGPLHSNLKRFPCLTPPQHPNTPLIVQRFVTKETDEDEDNDWPFTLNGHPFLSRHAQLASMRPQLSIVWPTPGYLFKRLNYGPTSFHPFLRVRVDPPSAAALFVGLDDEPLVYVGMAYFLNLPNLADGDHVMYAALGTPDGRHLLTEVEATPFSVNSSMEYEEDGAGDAPSLGIVPDRNVCATRARHGPDRTSADASSLEKQREEAQREEAQREEAQREEAQREEAQREEAPSEEEQGEEEQQGSCAGVLCRSGECVDGVCACPPDVIGEACEHSIITGTRFLPPRDPRESSSFCHRSVQHEELAAAMLDRIEALQFPALWQPEQTVHLSLNDTSGYGVTLHLIAQALSATLRNNQSLALHGKWSYFRHRECARPARQQDLSCYFEPVHSSCPAEVLWSTKDPPIFTANYQLDHDWHLPARFNVTGGGVFFWVSQLARYLMTPNRRLESLIRRVKRAIGFEHPIMGVHVRHGDSCPKWEDAHSHLPGAKCEKFERYLAEMEEIRRRYGVRRVFLCTDDPGVIQQLPMHPAFDFVYLHFDRALFAASDWAIELKLLMATMDRRMVAESTLVDLLLLADTDFFIGTLSSHFGSLAYELSVATKGYHPPYVSLDYAWQGSLLSPVQLHTDDGVTVDKQELNPKRRDFRRQ